MKLALYLPNFRDMVTVRELEDLTSLAEELDFDSVWTLDRIVVPEASDRVELQYSFGMMEEFPRALPVSSRGQWFQGWPLIPWLAAKTSKVRIGMSICDTPYRAPGVLAAELATVDHLSGGRLNVGLGAGWMPEEFAAASASGIYPRRHRQVRETIEIMQGIWTNDLFEYHGEFADFGRCGFGWKPVQKPHPPIFFSGLKDPARSASRISRYGLSGWIGIQDTPDELRPARRSPRPCTAPLPAGQPGCPRRCWPRPAAPAAPRPGMAACPARRPPPRRSRPPRPGGPGTAPTGPRPRPAGNPPAAASPGARSAAQQPPPRAASPSPTRGSPQQGPRST